MCGGGTRRSQDPPHPQAAELYRDELARKAAAEVREAFDAFYLAREVRFNGLDGLPVAEPRRRAA